MGWTYLWTTDSRTQLASQVVPSNNLVFSTLKNKKYRNEIAFSFWNIFPTILYDEVYWRKNKSCSHFESKVTACRFWQLTTSLALAFPQASLHSSLSHGKQPFSDLSNRGYKGGVERSVTWTTGWMKEERTACNFYMKMWRGACDDYM